VKIDGSRAVIGITDHAQSALGDIVYVELPKVGASLDQGKTMGVVESVKAVSDIFAPLSGTVTEVNSSVVDDPAKVNGDPFGDGWLVKIDVGDAGQQKTLLDAAAYDAVVEAESH
jgi:glycine cleavage system H protein